MAERDVEAEAEQQLLEQREALQELQRALQDVDEASEDAAELLAGYRSLEEAVAELEGLVVQLKRERLLAELAVGAPEESAAVNGGQPAAAPAAPLVVLGQAYRFRGPDGAFYDGVAANAEGVHALLRYARPTNPYQLAAACVPLAALLPGRAAPDLAPRLAPGASVIVLPEGPDGASGLWEAAEVVACGEAGANVILTASGRRVRVPHANVAASRFAEGWDADAEEADREPSASRAGDDAESSGSEGDEDENEDGEVGVCGRASMALAAAAAAVVSAAEAGPLSDTAHFAEFEAHTRGVGSRLLARWGYVAGRGLGARGQGMPAPLEVGRLHRIAGLGMGEPGGPVERKKRKRRGGERSRKRQFAEATRGAREAARDTQNAADLADPDAPGLFAFINASLGDGSAAAAVHRRVHADERRSDGLGLGVGAGRGEAGGGYFGNGPAAKAKAALALPDRQALAAQQDALQNLRQKVGRLKGMAVRNAKDRVMASQVTRKLADAQRELHAAEAAGAAAEQAVHTSERHKKWLKF